MVEKLLSHVNYWFLHRITINQFQSKVWKLIIFLLIIKISPLCRGPDWTGPSELRCFRLICLISVEVLFIIFSNLARPAHPFSVFCPDPDWPPMIDADKKLPCTSCQSCIDFIVAPTAHRQHQANYQGGWKVISRAAYLLVQTSPGPGFQKIIILCWTVAIFLLNTSGEGLAGELSGIAAYFLDLFLFAPVSIPKFGYFVNILTLFDSLMVYTECILCFHQPIIDCKLNGRNERRSEPFFLSVTKYLTNPMQRLLRRLYISYYGLLRNFSLV